MMKNLSLIRPPSGDGGLTIVEASSDQKAEQTVAHGAADHAVWLKQCRSPRPGERSRYPARFTGFKQSYEMAI